MKSTVNRFHNKILSTVEVLDIFTHKKNTSLQGAGYRIYYDLIMSYGESVLNVIELDYLSLDIRITRPVAFVVKL